MEKKLRLCWACSLLTITCITIVITIFNFIDFDLPDSIQRILGIIDLLAVFVLIFSTVKLKLWKKGEK